MRFPNAFKGVSKLFTAQVMMLIAGIAAVISGIVSVVVGALSQNSEVAAVGALVVFGVIVVVTAVFSVIAFILNLVGLIQARKDESSFTVALITTIVGIVASALMGTFQSNGLVSGLMNVIQIVASLATTLFVIQGIMKLANRLGNANMVNKGNTMFKLILAVQIIAIIARFIAALFANNTALLVVAGVLAIIAAVINVVVYFLFLSYLGKAKKMLA